MKWPETCSQADFARLIGASPRTVRDLGARGVIVYEGNAVRTVESLKAYADGLRKAAKDRAGSDGHDLISERAKLASTQRQRGEIALAKARSEVMDLDEVERGWDKLATVVREMVLAIPGLVKKNVPGLTHFDDKTVEKICCDVLDAAAEEIDSASIPGASESLSLRGKKAKASRTRIA